MLLLLPAVIMFYGCADTHQLMRAPGTSSSLAPQASAYISIPKDGSYNRRTYSGSGALTAQAVAAAFAPYLSKVMVGVRTEDFDAARKSARAGGYTYLINPEILQWEDRATEWSGRPDQASVKVSVVSMDTGTVLDSAVIGGKSGLATFGGDRPEHLLPKPLADYAATLFHPVTAGARPVHVQQAPEPNAPPTRPATYSDPRERMNQPAEPPPAPAPPLGQWTFVVEKLAHAAQCTAKSVNVTSSGPGFEHYSVPCEGGDVLVVRCEVGNCRILK